VAARPNAALNFDAVVRGQNQRAILQDEIAQLQAAQRIAQGGARNVGRDRLVAAAQQADEGVTLQATLARESARRRQVLEGPGLQRLNQEWDQLEDLRRQWAQAGRSPSDRSRKVTVKIPGVAEPVKGTPKQIVARIQAQKDKIELRGARVQRRVRRLESREQMALDAEGVATDVRRDAFQALQGVPERVVDQSAVVGVRGQLDERRALLQKLMSPTQEVAEQTVAQVADGSGAAAGAGKRRGRLLSGTGITAGIAAGIGFSSVQGGFQERAENLAAPDRLQSMIAGAANQRLEMLRAMAAMQRIEVGARQNLANLAMQQPHVFNEIMAGRQLAQGVVSVGGDRTAQMNRMAEVGAAMTTGQFNRMGSPDALGLLAQYMNQG
jgi:hypothetical protein